MSKSGQFFVLQGTFALKLLYTLLDDLAPDRAIDRAARSASLKSMGVYLEPRQRLHLLVDQFGVA